MLFSNKLVLALAAVISVASAAVIRAVEVATPAVTSPHAGDLWKVGSVQTITWDTSSIPPAEAGETGVILLGFIEDGSSDEHLDVDHPLATNFPIEAGAVQVTVPDVVSRDDYVVVLIGDSGNTSPLFSITN